MGWKYTFTSQSRCWARVMTVVWKDPPRDVENTMYGIRSKRQTRGKLVWRKWMEQDGERGKYSNYQAAWRWRPTSGRRRKLEKDVGGTSEETHAGFGDRWCEGWEAGGWENSGHSGYVVIAKVEVAPALEGCSWAEIRDTDLKVFWTQTSSQEGQHAAVLTSRRLRKEAGWHSHQDGKKREGTWQGWRQGDKPGCCKDPQGIGRR